LGQSDFGLKDQILEILRSIYGEEEKSFSQAESCGSTFEKAHKQKEEDH